METVQLKIEGMGCGHCVGQVTRALTRLEGVLVKHVVVGQATIEYDPVLASPVAISRAIDEAGYQVQAQRREV